MAIRPDQFAAEITAADITDLCDNHVPEDIYLEFKQILFTFPNQPPEQQGRLLENQVEDILSDLVAFANSYGGHLVIGIAPDGERADRIEALRREDATRISQIIRDRAAVFIKPRLALLEAVPFPMDARQENWVVVVTIPPGESRPHMSAFREQTRFTIREGNRKRSMTADEIRDALLAGPQSTAMAGLLAEVRGLRAVVEQMSSQITSETRPLWKRIFQK